LEGLIFWLTGLSGSGKSTLAEAVGMKLKAEGISYTIVDGDIVRSNYQKPLGLSEVEIKKNNYLISDYCIGIRSNVKVVLVSVISPYASMRRETRKKLTPGYFEVYCNADLNSVINRDVKGLYKKALAGTITNMIGLAESHPYEKPEHPDLEISTGVGGESRETSIEILYNFVKNNINGSASGKQSC